MSLDPLFDSQPFTVDRQADKLVVMFSGSVEIGEDVFQKLRLGQQVELRTSGVVTALSGRYARARDDDETITGVAAVRIETIYLPAPEEL